MTEKAISIYSGSLCILVLYTISILSSFSAQAVNIPDKLFGITLGAIHTLEDFPVKKITGISKIVDKGIHYYFQPIDGMASNSFQYIEKKTNPDDEFYATSFHTYMLPVIPSEITSMEQFNKAILKWEVVQIDWSEFSEESNNKAREEEYYWAFNLCKTFSVYFSVKPKISDFYDNKIYRCVFSFNEREFKVEAIGCKTVALVYNREIIDNQINVAETIIRRLSAKEILP